MRGDRRQRLAFRLAAYVAKTLDVDGMLAQLPDELFNRWMVYDSIEPIGSEANHRLLAHIGSASAWGKVTPYEMAPWLDKPRELTPAEQIAAIQAEYRGGT